MCEDIGERIRTARISKGLNREETANLLTEYGIIITASMIGALERGERRVAAETMFALASVFECPLLQLYGMDTDITSSILSDHEQDIVNYMFHAWEGDRHALIEFVGMYMAASPETRAQIAGTSLHIFRDARNAGMKIDVPYDVRTAFISKKWGELLDKE